MAEETKATKKPKRRTCAQTKKKMQRKSWYYRDGEYFINKSAFKAWKKKKLEEKKKEEEEKAKAEAEKAAAENKEEEKPATPES